MELKKKIYIFTFLILIYSCKSNSEPLQSLVLDSEKAFEITKKDSLILVTCTRCYCFVDAINSLNVTEQKILKKIPVYTDTNCNKLKISTLFIDRLRIDSISTDLYNIAFLKKVNDKYIVRILQVNESDKIISVLKSFFSM